MCKWYESDSFYNQTTILPGNPGLCGNRTSSQQSTFETVVDGLLSSLSIATPKTNGFYAAVAAPVVGTNTSIAYAIAQCVETVTPDGCKSCLQVAYADIRSCASDVIDGRAIDTACFMRYSGTAFFRNNQTTDITPFLRDVSGITITGSLVIPKKLSPFLLFISAALINSAAWEYDAALFNSEMKTTEIMARKLSLAKIKKPNPHFSSYTRTTSCKRFD
ncbi:hypothetical protein L1987_74633 [Smallanthus sonchifolius]|uniref:Uncharacterized protein n=1 Tax=Smallanthus sonchifolius TaxID=185202 RepID=A0ACB9A3H0_9ASTR|nr:hypothetical protein L1987_74633 [Smallanthus sonchifolius]